LLNNLAAAKNPVRPSKGMAEGGCGGNSAIPLQKIEASPAALQRKLFCWTASEASGGGLASLVPFKVGSSKVQNFPQKCLTGAG